MCQIRNHKEVFQPEWKWKYNTTYQNLCNAAKIVFRGQFLPINVWVKKNEMLKINDLIFYFRKLKIEEQTKAKGGKR